MSFEGVKLCWDLQISPDDLLNRADKLISRCRKAYDAIGNVEDEEVSFDNVLKALADVEGEFNLENYQYVFIQRVSTDKALREASCAADKKLSTFTVEIEMRQDLFQKLLVLESKQLDLPPEAKRYLDELLKTGRRNGMDLSEEKQHEIKSVKVQLNELEIQFRRNLGEDNTILEFSDEELVGLSDDFINNLSKCADSGKRKVTMKYPHIIPIMKKAKRPETRQRLEFAMNTKCIKKNPALLEQAVTLRQQLADLLGYPTYADYVMEVRMAKSVENILSFMMDLVEKLRPLWDDERKLMLELKEAECKELDIPFDGKLNPWDMGYYISMVKELKFAVDENKLREYFPLPVVTNGLLQIYQTLLGLTFEEIEHPKVWHPEVQVFKVSNTEDGLLLGYFFLDLFPREGKYSHAGLFRLQAGHLQSDGTRQIPFGGMLTNLTKPTSEKPGLLTHQEVKTFFHEFGHVMHFICNQAQHYRFSGIEVVLDFLEVPSKMLENWVWIPESLKMMSAHYVDGRPMPQEMMNSLIKSQLANVAYLNLRQICLSLFDIKIHTRRKVDTKEVYGEITKELLGLETTEGTNYAGTFEHLMYLYKAGYYSYMWSEVFSKDMFMTCFGERNVLNSTVGKEYRNKILKPGGTRDAMDLLKDFLGREPNRNAYLISLGLGV